MKKTQHSESLIGKAKVNCGGTNIAKFRTKNLLRHSTLTQLVFVLAGASYKQMASCNFPDFLEKTNKAIMRKFMEFLLLGEQLFSEGWRLQRSDELHQLKVKDINMCYFSNVA